MVGCLPSFKSADPQAVFASQIELYRHWSSGDIPFGVCHFPAYAAIELKPGRAAIVKGIDPKRKVRVHINPGISVGRIAVGFWIGKNDPCRPAEMV